MKRSKLDDQLDILNKEMLEMAALIQNAIEHVSKAIEGLDLESAKAAIELDNMVDRKERDIETICFKTILRQQPVAGDLRLISSALKMVTDMERIGDQAADISGIVLYLVNKPFIKTMGHLPQMANAASSMVMRAIEAFVNRDLELAREVVKMDDIVDNLFDCVKNELVELLQINKINGEQAIDLLMMAKYFERIGDHAENIAQWVTYAITGKYKGEVI